MTIPCDICANATSTSIWNKDGYSLVRCPSCNLVFVGNPPTAAQLQDLYSFRSGYHEELVRSEEEIDRHVGEARENLRVLAQNAQPSKILDVGCSTGLFLNEARNTGWQARGLEYSPDSASVARSQFGLEVDTGALVPGCYEDAAFDVITMWDVIEHLPSPSAALDVVLDILAPGGLFVAKTPNIDGLYPVASLAAASLTGFWGHPEPPGHLFQFSEATLSRLLRQKGLEVVRVYHQRIPMAYSFGDVKGWFRSFKWFMYASAFAPLAIAGPYLRRGDTVTIVARKSSGHGD